MDCTAARLMSPPPPPPSPTITHTACACTDVLVEYLRDFAQAQEAAGKVLYSTEIIGMARLVEKGDGHTGKHDGDGLPRRFRLAVRQLRLFYYYYFYFELCFGPGSLVSQVHTTARRVICSTWCPLHTACWLVRVLAIR